MATIKLPPVLDITASEVASELRAAIASGGDLVIQANDVTRIDASGVQLLCAAVIAVQARGGQVAWHTPSTVLADAARLLGVASMFGPSLAQR